MAILCTCLPYAGTVTGFSFPKLNTLRIARGPLSCVKGGMVYLRCSPAKVLPSSCPNAPPINAPVVPPAGPPIAVPIAPPAAAPAPINA